MSSNSWIKRHPRLVILFFNVAILIALEFFIRLLMKHGFVPYLYLPTSSETAKLYADIDPHFGVWRYPNRTVQHTLPCFDVNYTSNSYGARDLERTKTSAASRVVVLGDSYVDGFGVELKDRMTNIAEDFSDMEFLNFGTAGNFGPIQQWLLYKELGSQFDHQEVHIFFFPSNDFAETDPGNFPSNRYRPYLRKKADSTYEVYYTVPFSERLIERPMSQGRVLRRTVTNNIYIFNLLRQISEIFENLDLKDSVADKFKSKMIPSYDDYTRDEMELVEYSYEQIIGIAGERKVRIFLVPTEKEFMQYNYNKDAPFRIISEMQKFASRFKNVEIYDLLPVFVKYASDNNINYEDFFLKCNSHWSPLGNFVAGQYLASIADMHSKRVLAHDSAATKKSTLN